MTNPLDEMKENLLENMLDYLKGGNEVSDLRDRANRLNKERSVSLDAIVFGLLWCQKSPYDFLQENGIDPNDYQMKDLEKIFKLTTGRLKKAQEIEKSFHSENHHYGS